MHRGKGWISPHACRALFRRPRIFRERIEFFSGGAAYTRAEWPCGTLAGVADVDVKGCDVDVKG
eukprot:5394787-Pyramimonas_sp.AAC.1